MKYDFTSIVSRKDTSSFKTNKSLIKKYLNSNYYEDSISMWVADMDFKCAPEIIIALKDRLDKDILGYTGLNNKYYSSIIEWYKIRYNTQIKKQWITYSNGTITAIRNSIRALTNKNDGVIIQSPVYFPFASEILETNRKIVNNYLIKNDYNYYSIDFNDFEAKCKDPNNKLFIFCNPHNPTGNIWSKEDTQRLIDICNKNNVIMFSDEIHSDLLRNEESFTSTIKLNNNHNVITATGINKTFNLAGLQVTNLIIPNDDLRNKLNDYTGMILISPLSLEATITAYTKCSDWLDELKNVLDDNINYMYKFIKENLPKIKFNKPQGTYLTWLDFTQYKLSEKELLMKLSEEAHLILEGGSMFNKNSEGFIRINIACPKEVLIDALNRIYRVLGE